MVKIEYQYLNGESVLDSCGSCTGLELVINTDNYFLCGQKYFELRIVNVVYDDSGNQIIYFSYNGDLYGTTMSFNDFISAIKDAFECPPNPQCTIQETSFDWSITPQLGDKYISDNIVRPAGTSTNYIYSFLDLTINGITYLLGDIWDDATQGKACDNVKDYIDAIIYYLSNQSIPEFLGANNLAENGMSNNYDGDGLLELYFLPGTTVSIQIQDTGSSVGTFNYSSSLITQAILSINNTSVVDSGDVIIAESVEVTDGELERTLDDTTQTMVIYNAYEYQYNFNFQKGLIISLCIDTQLECILNNFAQIIVTPTQMQSVFGGSTISGSTGTSNTAPVNILAPYIFGIGAEGGILNVNSGAWTGVPTPTLTYDWQYSTDGGLTWNSYTPAEIGLSYTCLSTDVGNLIRCEVTATNIAGVASAYSNSILVIAGGNCAPTNVVASSISGTTLVGSVLTANNGTWVGATSYSYEWFRNGISIGVITSTYTTVSADAGQNIQCIVTGINAYGQNEIITNAIVPTIAPANTSIPIVYGDIAVGSVLSVYEGEWDGYPTPSFTYNWQYSNDGGASWNNFSPVEIGNTYTIVSGDLGNTIRCQVDGTNTEGFDSADSAGVFIPTGYTPTAPTFAVNPTMNVLGAYPMAGVYLEITDGMCNGTDPIAFSYQWKSNGSTILGETNSTYEIQLTDFGDLIECEVTASNGVSPDVAFTPTGVTVVQKPINTIAPSISGTISVGSTISVNVGTWSGNPTITYNYQWKRGFDNIGTNSPNYTILAADLGKDICCEVTGINAYGNSVANTNIVTIKQAPSNVVLPSIYGNNVFGDTLRINTGSWDAFPAISSYGYNWQFSTNGGSTWNNYSPIQIGATYIVANSDIGRLIRCQVTAINSEGNGNANTNDVLIDSAPINTTPPFVSGALLVGSTLSTTDGTWTGSGVITFTYKWLRNGNPILGEISNSYVTVTADIGATIQCEVTATNSIAPSIKTSNAIIPTSAPSLQQPPIIFGSYNTGGTLTAQDGVYGGYPASTITRKWQYSTDDITYTDYSPAQTGTTYTIQPSDTGLYIRILETATNGISPNVSTASNSIQIASLGACGAVIQGVPIISGIQIVSRTLSCSIAPLTITGSPTPSVTYQWYYGLTMIAGATTNTYTLQPAQSGERVWCRVTASNVNGTAYVDSNELPIFLTIADKYPTGWAHGWWPFLLSGAYYGQPIIRIIRDSDSAQLDITHDSTGMLDVSAITAHCTGTTGRVMTIYNPIGGQNLTQTTNSLRPIIFTGGSVVTDGGVPIICNLTVLNSNLTVAGSNTAGTFNFLHNGTQATYAVYLGCRMYNATYLIFGTGQTSSTGFFVACLTTNQIRCSVFNGTTTIITNNSSNNTTALNKNYLVAIVNKITATSATLRSKMFFNQNAVAANVQAGAAGTGNPLYPLYLGNFVTGSGNTPHFGALINLNETYFDEIREACRKQLNFSL